MNTAFSVVCLTAPVVVVVVLAYWLSDLDGGNSVANINLTEVLIGLISAISAYLLGHKRGRGAPRKPRDL